MSLLTELNKLPSPDDSGKFLDGVKKVLQEFKALTPSIGEDDIGSNIEALVEIYLCCSSKLTAKRAMASFFQGFNDSHRKIFETQLCIQLKEALRMDATNNRDSAAIRQCVDNINSLMENFKLGEQCLFTIFIDVLTFLVQAKKHFLSGFGPNVPPVHLNEVMLHCHVTVQTINLFLQKTAAEQPEKMNKLFEMPQLVSELIDLDIEIIHNDTFLLDCRCCCAMNVFLLLHLATPEQNATDLIPSLIFPIDIPLNDSAWPAWLSNTQTTQLCLDSVPPLTFLVLTFGYVAMVTVPGILHKSGALKNFFYVDVLLPRILITGKGCDDSPSKTLFAKTVNLWTNKLLSALAQSAGSEHFVLKIEGDSAASNSLLDYVWTHWEDQLDILYQSAKTVFENLLKLHVTACLANDKESAPFIMSILCKVFKVSWSSRGKFSALVNCVQHIGTKALLNIRPFLPGEVLEQLQEQAISCHASELYSQLFLSHRKEETSSNIGTNMETLIESKSKHSSQSSNHDQNSIPSSSFSQRVEISPLETWISPIIRAMHSSDKKWKQNIIEYLLPKLMKNDVNILDFIIEWLSVFKGDNSVNVNLVHGAIIMCMRRARAIGLLKSRPQITTNELWYGILHPSILKSALSSSDEQIRLDAFALLCENCKTTEAVSCFEFEMIKLFIPYNINSQSPAFRQTFLSLVKKLFFRIKESLSLLNKLKAKKSQSVSQDSLDSYNVFLSWLTALLLGNLYPGSSFAQRTSCLSCLTLMATFFSSPKDGFSPFAQMTDCNVLSFLECLTDTFEENKKEALSMLTKYTELIGSIGTFSSLNHLMKISFTLACSTKPQDCITAAYLFKLLLKQPAVWELMKDFEMDLCSDEIRRKYESVKSNFVSLEKSIKPLTMNTERVKHLSTVFLLNMLCLLLDDQIEIAHRSLVTAAANQPMYPTLLCIRYTLQDIEWNAIPSDLIVKAQQFIQGLLRTSLDLAAVVSPVVQNSSPEGNVPVDAIGSPDMSDFFHSLNIDNDAKTLLTTPQAQNLEAQSVILSQMLVEAMPEYLVVCCWRSIKEVSLTLGNLCLQIPIRKISGNQISDNSQDSSALILLSFSQIEIIGEYFIRQLLESIHRGAFELAYAGFQLMCQMLWNHPDATCHRLPAKWLQQVMQDIQASDQHSKFCATRRSAGVPFFVQAIISTEPMATGRNCFHNCIKELLILASDQGQDSGPHKEVQVHALNILRTLYRDARLGEDVVPYIPDGLKAAVLGFKSDLWAVRNSATILLSALMTRIFGVKRSKDESLMSMKNCQTGRSFFHRYPSLYPFLLGELKIATASVSDSKQDVLRLHPSLYPVLLVLGRLFPSTLEGSDTSLSLSAFIPFILKCASSPVYKTRIMAARALQPLAKGSQVADVINIIMDTFLMTQPGPCAVNLWHGSLLQLNCIMKLVETLNDSLKEKVLTIFISKFVQCFWLLSPRNLCFTTRVEVLRLVDTTFDVAKSMRIEEGDLRQNMRSLKIYFLSMLASSAKETSWKPSFHEFQKMKANLTVKYLLQFESWMLRQESQQESTKGSECCDGNKPENNSNMNCKFREKLVSELLGSLFYEVRLEAMNAMLFALQSPYSETGDKDSQTMFSYKVSQCKGDGEVKEEHSQLNIREKRINQMEHKRLMTTLSVSFFDFILELAMGKEEHYECMKRAFQLLAKTPECSNLLKKKGSPTFKKVFIDLLQRIQKEARMEVKAAMLRFSSCFVPLLYEGIKSVEESSEELSLIKQWIYLQNVCSRSDADPDVQVDVACSILDNANILLCDPLHKLGSLSISAWEVLALLLQADDLEVKDIASSAVSAVCNQNQDTVHPNYALHKLPEFLLKAQTKLGLNKLFDCLVSWVLLEDMYHEKASEQRLFEKGEMNTYWDHISFSHSVAQVLVQLLDCVQSSSSACLSGPELKILMSNFSQTELQASIASVVAKLASDLDSCEKDGETFNIFSNSGEYSNIWHKIYHVDILTQIFQKCQGFNVTLFYDFASMERRIDKLKDKLSNMKKLS